MINFQPTEKELKRRESSVKRTTTTLYKVLQEQKRLGNLKAEDVSIAKNKKLLKKIVENYYNFAPKDESINRTQDLAKQFTRTGTVVKEGISKRTGKVYIKAGREVKNLFKSLKQKMKQDQKNFIEIERDEIAGYDEKKNRIFKRVKYRIDNPTDMKDFISQLKGASEIIAFRIELGEPREEVLRDYGY